MTGLDIDNDVIIEIFCLITNGKLELLDDEGWGAVIHQDKEIMDKMVRNRSRKTNNLGATAMADNEANKGRLVYPNPW
jgi:oligoribonuclease